MALEVSVPGEHDGPVESSQSAASGSFQGSSASLGHRGQKLLSADAASEGGILGGRDRRVTQSLPPSPWDWRPEFGLLDAALDWCSGPSLVSSRVSALCLHQSHGHLYHVWSLCLPHQEGRQVRGWQGTF